MDKSGKFWIWIGAGAVIILLVFMFAFTTPFARHNDTQKNPANNTNVNHTTNPNTNTTNDYSSAESLKTYLSEQNTIMPDMVKKMTVTPTGNASLDFLKGMIPHHESAITMAKSYLTHGRTHDKLEDLAEDIIEDQNEEIREMKRLIQEIEASGVKDEAKEKAYMDSYKKILSGHKNMEHGASSYSSVEHAFAENMIVHHQMAVDMSKAILSHTDHKEVRELAEDIIEEQELEIIKMQRFLKDGVRS